MQAFGEPFRVESGDFQGSSSHHQRAPKGGVTRCCNAALGAFQRVPESESPQSLRSVRYNGQKGMVTDGPGESGRYEVHPFISASLAMQVF